LPESRYRLLKCSYQNDAMEIQMRIRLQLAIQLLATAFCLIALPAAADNYPSKPIRLIVPFPAGGGVDVLARIIGQKMSDDFHQPVIVEDRPGAAGIIGTEAIARAVPDGYTILLGTVGTHGIKVEGLS
jgi:tripartite-type tricarboxylate transporter receptor subunit TctC